MKKSSSKSTLFKLELNGLVLPKADKKRIAAALTKTFKSEIAKTDLAKAAGGGKKGGQKVGYSQSKLAVLPSNFVHTTVHPGWAGYVLNVKLPANWPANIQNLSALVEK